MSFVSESENAKKGIYFYERYYSRRRFRHKALSVNQGDIEAAASDL